MINCWYKCKSLVIEIYNEICQIRINSECRYNFRIIILIYSNDFWVLKMDNQLFIYILVSDCRDKFTIDCMISLEMSNRGG